MCGAVLRILRDAACDMTLDAMVARTSALVIGAPPGLEEYEDQFGLRSLYKKTR